MSIEEIYGLLKENNFKFSTDSRKINENDVFFAIKGEKFNANDFAKASITLGASYAIVDDKNLGVNPQLLLVDDVLKTLQQLATHHRRTLGVPVIAIAGSNGKTTTKELVSAILKKKYKVHVTPGNFNNHIGLPITLLSTPTDTELIVLEMGANHIGEIAELCEIAEPTHGLITNIGKEHLEGFGSIEGVAQAESELYLYLQKNHGTAFVNMDDPWLKSMSKRLSVKFTYGITAIDLDAKVSIKQTTPSIMANINGLEIKSQLSGTYNLENMIAAVSLGTFFKVKDSDIKEAVASYQPKNNRSQIIEKNSIWILLDAYNANPSSVEKALENFSSFDYPNKTVILGDMFELGNHSEKEHKYIVNKVSESGFSQMIFVGPDFYKAANSIKCLRFQNFDELEVWAKSQIFNNTAFLIKGSRGMAMERIVPALIGESIE